jgi:hypothetical protein
MKTISPLRRFSTLELDILNKINIFKHVHNTQIFPKNPKLALSNSEFISKIRDDILDENKLDYDDLGFLFISNKNPEHIRHNLINIHVPVSTLFQQRRRSYTCKELIFEIKSTMKSIDDESLIVNLHLIKSMLELLDKTNSFDIIRELHIKLQIIFDHEMDNSDVVRKHRHDIDHLFLSYYPKVEEIY